jgi:cytochrome b
MNSSSSALRRADAGTPESSAAPSAAAHRSELPIAVEVWDPALRACHWLLATAVVLAVITGEVGGPWIDWHARAGEAIAGLLAFRLAWGLIGPPTARFASFVRGPGAIRHYLQGHWHGVGHNPLGALSVIALLLLGVLQVGSGLFANDDIAFQGPLAALVSSHWSDRAAGVHQKLSWLLIGAVALHLLAIAWYRWAHRNDLIGPMLHGRRALAPQQLETFVRSVPAAGADRHSPRLRLLLAAGAGLLTVVIASGRLLPQAGAAPTFSAPAAQAPVPARPSW